jgi:hypothetical protein
VQSYEGKSFHIFFHDFIFAVSQCREARDKMSLLIKLKIKVEQKWH